MKRRKFLIGVAVGLLLVAAPCAAESPIKIGVIQSLTGAAREDGQTVVRALQLAQEKINKEQEQKVELLIEDDGTQAKNTVSAFHKLTGQGVVAIIGPTWLHTLASVVPLSGASKVVMFNTSNFPEAIDFTGGQGYVFTNAYSLAEDTKTFRRYAQERKIKKLALIRNSTNWALLQVDYYRRIARELGVSVVSEYDAVDVENNDWRSILPKIKAAEPDTVVFFLGRDDAETFVLRASEINLPARLFGGSHTYDAWKRAEDKGPYEAVCLTYPLARLQSRREFLELFEKRYGEPPQLYADSSYDALFILYNALELAKRNKQQLKDVLVQEEFTGLFGKYRYSAEKSLACGGTSLNCVEKGILRVQE
jgi:branched-chain amino acid transport system substrate-binding protein